jgi:H+/gluconate symporter-like permease
MDDRNRERGTFIMPLPPDEKFIKTRSVARWLKEHVLAAVIISIITIVLGIYIPRWLSSTEDQNHAPTSEPPKTMENEDHGSKTRTLRTA